MQLFSWMWQQQAKWMLTKSRMQQNDLFQRIQKSSRNNLKIHTHLFYINHLEEPVSYQIPEGITSFQPGKSDTNFTKKAGKRSPANTDRDF